MAPLAPGSWLGIQYQPPFPTVEPDLTDMLRERGKAMRPQLQTKIYRQLGVLKAGEIEKWCSPGKNTPTGHSRLNGQP